MRPDVENAVRAVVGEGSEPSFYAPSMRRSSSRFRFPDLFEEGCRVATDGAAVYDEVDIGESVHVACVQRGIWLTASGGERIAVLFEVTEGMRRTAVRVEVASAPAGQARAESILGAIRALAEKAGTFRGRVLAPSEPEYAFDSEGITLRRTDVAPVGRAEIVLAPGLLELVERNTIGFAAQRSALIRLGMSPTKGILLYGPPGTGKTLLVRYLVTALASHTRFILSGDKLAFLGDTVEAASLLAPSVVVIEDVDLVAAHRDGPYQGTPAVLNRLLNDMDGAGQETEILYILTTNRPEVLEPALAARPGRVDQAIAIGLPEEAERLKLLRLYTRQAGTSEDILRAVSRRSGRVSPAFLREIARRAMQEMLSRRGTELVLADFEQGFVDMLGAEGKVTARLLGAESVGFVA